MSDRDLTRFVDAQSGGEYESALAEMQAGRKRSHWIWYVFPQVSGLGMSHMSQLYAIGDRDEAIAYLHHPVLFARLLEILTAVAEHVRTGVTLERLMGSSIDAAKLVSSLTLFGEVARGLTETPTDANAVLADLAEEVLIAAAAQGYPRCRHTLERLREG
jgi:uncharacterized protein (DUF1810 family)